MLRRLIGPAIAVTLLVGCGGVSGPYTVIVTPQSPRIGTDISEPCQVTVLGANGDTVHTPRITWTSSNDSILTVDTLGIITGLAVGTATVQATYQTAEGGSQITVFPSLVGNWSGSVYNLTFQMMLSENTTGTVSGTGELTDGHGGAVGLGVVGQHSQANVSLSFQAAGYIGAGFQGTMTSDSVIQGTLLGSGFQGEPITFIR